MHGQGDRLLASVPNRPFVGGVTCDGLETGSSGCGVEVAAHTVIEGSLSPPDPLATLMGARHMATETTSLDRGSSIKVMVDIVRLPPVEGLLVACGPALFVRVVLKVAPLLLVLLGGQGWV